MRNINSGILLIAFVVLSLTLSAGVALGAGIHTGEFDAARTGQATAGITMTENAAVVGALPAAMVRLREGSQVLGGITSYDGQFDAQTADGANKASTETDLIIGPHFYYADNRGLWAWGIGLYYPFNVVIDWPKDGYFRTNLESEELITRYISFSGAYALTDQLSLGASVIRIDATAVLKKDLFLGGPFFSQIELDAKADRFGSNFSVLYNMGNLSFAANHSPKYTLEAEGSIAFDGLAAAASDDVTATLGLPSVTEVAVSWKDNPSDPDIFAEIAVILEGWSNFRDIAIIGKSDGLLIERIDKNWEDTTTLKAGGNYVLSRSGSSSHRVRAGILLDESPIPANELAGDVPDGEGRTEFAFGYGYKSGNFLIDAAYFLVMFKDSESTNPDIAVGGSNTQFSGDVTIFSVSAGYSF